MDRISIGAEGLGRCAAGVSHGHAGRHDDCESDHAEDRHEDQKHAPSKRICHALEPVRGSGAGGRDLWWRLIGAVGGRVYDPGRARRPLSAHYCAVGGDGVLSGEKDRLVPSALGTEPGVGNASAAPATYLHALPRSLAYTPVNDYRHRSGRTLAGQSISLIWEGSTPSASASLRMVLPCGWALFCSSFIDRREADARPLWRSLCDIYRSRRRSRSLSSYTPYLTSPDSPSQIRVSGARTTPPGTG